MDLNAATPQIRISGTIGVPDNYPIAMAIAMAKWLCRLWSLAGW